MMNKNTIFAVTFLSVSLGMLSACNKEQTSLNRLEGGWQLVSRVENGQPVSPTPDISLFFGPCKKGGTGTFSYMEGASDGSVDSGVGGMYHVSADSKILYVDNNYYADIPSLTTKKLVLSGQNNQGVQVEMTFKQ